MNAFSASLEMRSELLTGSSLQQIVDAALLQATAAMPVQSAALFLYDKSGVLTRRGIVGRDRHGNPIPPDWFPEERHRAGEGFTGSVLKIPPGRTIAVPRRTQDLEGADTTIDNRARYLDLLGSLHSAVAVPLNGLNRAFGVLEVINRCDEHGSLQFKRFSNEDVTNLFMFASSIASSISAFRRNREFGLLAELGSKLVFPFRKAGSTSELYELAATRLVDASFPFSAAIVRVAREDRTLPVAGKAGNDIDWSAWVDEPRVRGPSVMARVFESGKRVVIQSISHHRDELPNRRWIDHNGLETYACYPLRGPSQPVGTLSVLTRYLHRLSDSDHEFLTAVADLIAAAVESTRVVKELRDAHRELLQDTQERMGVASKVAHHAAKSEGLNLRHRLKNDLILVQDLLEEALGPGHRLSAIKRAKAIADERIEELQASLQLPDQELKTAPVNINTILTESVQRERRAVASNQGEQPIEIELVVDDHVPVIAGDEEEITVVIQNLLNNAIRAIRHSRARIGKIHVSSGFKEHKGIRHIVIRVLDNGIGIPKDNLVLVFDEHFTTYDKGTGMGLYTARNTISKYGGHVLITDSQVGRGTTFEVLLPVDRLAYLGRRT